MTTRISFGTEVSHSTGCQVPPFSSFFLLFQQCPPFSSFLGKMSSLSSFFMIFRALPIKMYFFGGILFGVGAFRWHGTWDNPSIRKEGQGTLVCLVGLAIYSWITGRKLGLSHTVVLTWHLVRLASLH